ncbi:site-specific integrase [Chryseobacterium sp. FH1]|uniref:site-specific integrase n=1 Tax=Chryseobacterium sp. FH1 TaxID=1233951 RepID=UPI0013F3ADE2|nr:site-specific integrase [Chryseobacterium sp. FH1]
MTTSYRFSLRTYQDKEGKCLIYLDVRDSKKRIRYPIEIKINPSLWDPKKQRLKKSSDKHIQEISNAYNLVLENIEAKLVQIKTTFILREQFLDAETMIEEFQTSSPDFDFISFYRHHLSLQSYSKQTLKNHNSVLKKLSEYKSEIPFHKIDENFFLGYRKKYNKNSEVTYFSDVKCMKKFLNLAVKKGIRIGIEMEDLKIRFAKQGRVYLMPDEVKKLINYYYNEFIQESHKLPLGYFLFSCYTGLRISDIQQRKREEILHGVFQFNHQKTGNFQSMRLNEDGKKLLLHNPDLFKVKIVEQKINAHLKIIAERCKISKKLTMHVGRHTFATTYYRNTKDVIGLKKLLGHSNISNTLIYTHLVEGEEMEGLETVTY